MFFQNILKIELQQSKEQKGCENVLRNEQEECDNVHMHKTWHSSTRISDNSFESQFWEVSIVQSVDDVREI